MPLSSDIDLTKQKLLVFPFLQVGAIILYTYVFQMLAPPPSGSFDFQEEEKLPIKDLPVNPSPNQIPLLAPQDLEPSLHSTRKGKV